MFFCRVFEVSSGLRPQAGDCQGNHETDRLYPPLLQPAQIPRATGQADLLQALV
jgi:hypothetical protein